MDTFTTIGSVRGSCDHQHRSIRAAVKCIDLDDRSCKRGCGSSTYSDRTVKRGDGSPLDTADYEDIGAGVYDGA